MSYYTTSQLSENMELTPEGYLLCKAVPIARTGAMEYLPDEVPAEIAKNFSGPTVLVYREAMDVFSLTTMASYEGKDVTVDHPDDFVSPKNWRELACGHSQNVRQGEGHDADLLLADLLIKDQTTIDLIIPPKGEESASGEPQEPLREVSCGYDADYEFIAPGIGKQTNIIGNHIALVPHGRCGSRCAIKDTNQQIKDIIMTKFTSPNKKLGWWDRIMGNPKVKKAMDEAAAEEKAKDEAKGEEKAKDEQQADPEKEQQTATDSDEKLDEILLMLRSLLDAIKPKDSDATNNENTGDIDPDQTDDENSTSDSDEQNCDEKQELAEKTKTGDRRMRSADKAVVLRAGILAPALRFQIGDSANMVKRAALRQAMSDKAVARVVDNCLNGTALTKADGITLDSAFIAASELMRARNNERSGAVLSTARYTDNQANGPSTAADINKANREYRDSLKK